MVNRKDSRTLPDDALIALAREGDTIAFAELVRRYEETVYRFSLKLCRDRGQAEETLQDTFINVFRKLKSFDGRSKFTTWLYAIVANNCLMKRRRRKLAELEDPLEVLDSPATDEDGRFVRHVARWEQTPVDIMLDKELKKVLEDAMDGLPKLYRAVFALRDMEGKTSEETAEILNISVEAVKSRLRRARAFLRDALSPYMETHHKG